MDINGKSVYRYGEATVKGEQVKHTTIDLTAWLVMKMSQGASDDAKTLRYKRKIHDIMRHRTAAIAAEMAKAQMGGFGGGRGSSTPPAAPFSPWTA